MKGSYLGLAFHRKERPEGAQFSATERLVTASLRREGKVQNLGNLRDLPEGELNTKINQYARRNENVVEKNGGATDE